ncbi:RIP metalloprotease RseP [Pontibacter akesuensis]|uniref:Zinc metalloprotease n=1 Tax=Pontibacter akesuensis TaxID=388950 RepID=A0A1I7J977_9BACT|nr:RIP metalloprotease RseP [Pontibacter akesuensis]SFU81733.1 site-2 protease. Metallo peptidase. MEROPS family M50B [Pontibacter akesuensis]
MDIVVMVAQLILGLTILVGLHELGHMLAAKWFGMRVEKYAIGFPPKVFSKKFGETEYMLGLIPLGGFVKISGMVDESMDTEALKEEPKPWEFRAKPAWQRLIVMMGGIIVNVITGIVIYVALTYSYGESYLPASEAKYGVVPNEIGQDIGFRTGDKVVAVNGEKLQRFNDVYSIDAILGRNSYYTVERNGELIDLKVPVDLADKLADKEERMLFVQPRLPFKVGQVVKGSAADEAGLKVGDTFKTINGKNVMFFNDFQEAMLANAGKKVVMVVERNGKPIKLQAEVGDDGTLGFYQEPLVQLATREYSLGESIPMGTEQAFGVITANLKGFGKIFRGEMSASKSLSGPIGIAQIFGDTFNWYKFWSITAMLSMVLAFMNFLPIPALDGGHVVFLTYEIISGRKPSDNFLENAQKVGMVLLLGLMAFAIFNDVFKIIF